MNKLIITYKLTYDPFLKYTDKGNCKMKCPLGECLLELVLEGCLDKVVQSVEVKVESDIEL